MAVYVDARLDNLRAIDYVDGKEILEYIKKKSLISLLKEVAEYFSHEVHKKDKDKKVEQLQAAIVIDNIDERSAEEVT